MALRKNCLAARDVHSLHPQSTWGGEQELPLGEGLGACAPEIRGWP